MTGRFILAIDQGTHASRAMVYDQRGKLLADAWQVVDLRHDAVDHFEQDANEIVDSVRSVVNRVVHQVGRHAIACAGLAAQRSSVLAWNRRTGDPLSPVIGWQDTRAAEWLAMLDMNDVDIRQRTGLQRSAHYGASKLHWLFRHSAAVKQAATAGELFMGPLASFLLFRLLTGRPAVVDEADAARTLLWNIHSRQWDMTLLEAFGQSTDHLPQSRPVMHDYGLLEDWAIPLTAVTGDQPAALYASGQPDKSTVMVNLGTGAFVQFPLDSKQTHDSLLTSVVMSRADQLVCALEGTVNGAGSAIEVMSRQIGIDVASLNLEDYLNRVSDPPLFINTIGGLGSPWWRNGLTAELVNESGESIPIGSQSVEVVMAAVIESIVFMLANNIELLRQVQPVIDRLLISGGLSKLDGLCQRLVNLTGLEAYRSDSQEATSRGVAWLAAGQINNWQRDNHYACFSPQPNNELDRRYHHFLQIMMDVVTN